MTRPTIPKLICLKPLVKVKTIKRYALLAYRNFSEIRANLAIETVAIHSAVSACVPEAYETRLHFQLDNSVFSKTTLKKEGIPVHLGG